MEEAAWLQETTPQNTRNSTKWSVKIFQEWQIARSNKVAANESLGFDYGKVDEAQDLTVDIAQMPPLAVFKLLDNKVHGRNWKSFDIDLPSSTSSLLSDKSDETQASFKFTIWCTKSCYKCCF